MGIASPSTLSPTGVKGGSQYFSYPNNPRRRGAESNIGKSLRVTLGCCCSGLSCSLVRQPQGLLTGWAPLSGLPSGMKALMLPCGHIGVNLVFDFFLKGGSVYIYLKKKKGWGGLRIM